MRFGAELKRALRPSVHRARLRRDALLGGNCLVLLYHRVIELESDPQLLAVTPDRFDAQLAWLKKRCVMLTAEEFDSLLASGKRFPRNSALITFDDGYADNHLHARPILERHGLQGLFFISTGYIGSGREYWWDELERLLLLNTTLPQAVRWERHGLRLQWSERPADQVLREHYELALELLRGIPSAARDSAMEELRALLNNPDARPSHLPMSIAELQVFASSPAVALGAHTVGHPSLARISAEEQRREFRASKEQLEAWIGKPVTRFAYPFGTGADFSATTLRIAEE
ncbi:MAG: polysaccharide deacetylase family protein, partial [Flavobacteriales bacterium]